MKNTLAENMLRFGVKNLSKLEKTTLAEQTPVKTVVLSNEINNLPIGKKVEYVGVTTNRKVTYTDGGEGFVQYSNANIVKLSNDTVLILGDRIGKSKKPTPVVAIVSVKTGVDQFIGAAMQTNLVDLVKSMLTYQISLNESDYYNIFTTIGNDLRAYVNMSTKQELDTLAKTIPGAPAKVNQIETALNIV